MTQSWRIPIEPTDIADMRATAARARAKSRPSVCLNMVTNGTMLAEYVEAVAKVEELISQLHIQNTITNELKLHLLLAGILP